MKTFKVEVLFADDQPEDGQVYTEVVTVQAVDTAHAERLAMEKCAKEFWSYEPIDAVAEEIIETQEKAA